MNVAKRWLLGWLMGVTILGAGCAEVGITGRR